LPRLLHIITGLKCGGAEAVLIRLLSELREDYELKVISLSPRTDRAAAIRDLDVPLEVLAINPSLPSPLKLYQLYRSIREFDPHLVQTWMYHADLLGGLAARLATDAPVIWSLRQSNIDPEHTSWSTRLVIRICSFLSHYIPEKIISCSEAGKKVHAEKGYPIDKIEVVPNAYDLDEFSLDPQKRNRVRSELELAEEDFLIGYVARFHPQKDHRNFVEAAKILSQKSSNSSLPPGGRNFAGEQNSISRAAGKSKTEDPGKGQVRGLEYFPNSLPPGGGGLGWGGRSKDLNKKRVKFLLCGRGTDKNHRLREWIAEAGLKDDFLLLGERADIPAVNNALDLATMTSAFGEGFPNVVAEAMACATPCVVTDVGDAAKIIADTGEVVPIGDPEALAQAWQKFCNMPPEERGESGKKARERIKENYSIEAVLSQFEEIYKQLR